MKLLTKAIATSLAAADARSLNGESLDKIIVKFFNPAGAQSWFITSGTPLDSNGEPTSQDNATDWHLFGYCDLGFAGCAELGYVLLSELQSIKGQFGLGIERDLYFSGTLKDVMPGEPQPESLSLIEEITFDSDASTPDDAGVEDLSFLDHEQTS